MLQKKNGNVKGSVFHSFQQWPQQEDCPDLANWVKMFSQRTWCVTMQLHSNIKPLAHLDKAFWYHTFTKPYHYWHIDRQTLPILISLCCNPPGIIWEWMPLMKHYETMSFIDGTTLSILYMEHCGIDSGEIPATLRRCQHSQDQTNNWNIGHSTRSPESKCWKAR